MDKKYEDSFFSLDLAWLYQVGLHDWFLCPDAIEKTL